MKYVSARVGYATLVFNGAYGNSGLSASYYPNPASLGTPVTISVSGGTAPYTYTVTSGSGSMSGNVYNTPSNPDANTAIQVNDATGLSTTVTISFASSNVITALSVSTLGAHLVGGGGCASGATQVGAVADSYGNYIYGDQIFCSVAAPATTTSQVITDITITAGGWHVWGGVACPSGYVQVGQISDCAGGMCSGTQNVCAAVASSSSSAQAVKDVYMTPSNAHSPSPTCNAGYTVGGATVDCGYGTCSGLQYLCVKH